MMTLETFSVYNNLLSAALPGAVGNRLGFLLPADHEHGWHVSRNLLKPLNHLDSLRHKEGIARRLNLHNLSTPAELFDANYAMLEEHQGGRCSTAEVVDRLAAQSPPVGDRPPRELVRTLLQDYATVRHVEFHPSDVCNLTCNECTYGHDDPETRPLPVNFPFGAIAKVARLQPRSMVVIGGGEPTLYRSVGHRFQEMVEEICRHNPGITLALVTNGTHMPAGSWPDRFSWIRLSLDAATDGTYRTFRGKPLFRRVVKNFLRYLDHNVPYVGVSFLFANSNIHEYANVAEFIFNLVRREKPQHLHKVNIQYRPLRRDPYDYGKPFKEAVSHVQIERAVAEVTALASVSHEMEEFLRNQTNITAVLGGSSHPPHEFSRCYYSQTFRIVRANGELRPCFIRVIEKDFLLGNIQRDSLQRIALNTLYIGARRKLHCDAHGCRQCHVNYTFEKGLRGEMEPSSSPQVRADPMF